MSTALAAMFSVIGAMFLGVVGWAIRLESRVSVADQRHTDLVTLINFQFNALDKRLERMERALNGAMRQYNREEGN